MEERLKLKQILETIKPQVNFDSEQMILNEGILDSLDIIRLVMEIERTFEIKLQPEDLKKENFKDSEAICTMIAEKRR